jgi:hypothetical protein
MTHHTAGLDREEIIGAGTGLMGKTLMILGALALLVIITSALTDRHLMINCQANLAGVRHWGWEHSNPGRRGHASRY